MNSRDLVSMSLRNLWRRKLRTVLTILGVIIGATSIIIMLSLGLAMQKSNNELLESMGSLTTLEVMGTSRWDPLYSSGPMPNSGLVTDKSIEQIMDIPHVLYASPKMMLKNGSVKIGKYLLAGQIFGVEPEYFTQFNKNIVYGQTFQKDSDWAIILPDDLSFMVFDPNAKEQTFNQQVDLDPLKEHIVLTLGQNMGDIDFGAFGRSEISLPTFTALGVTQKYNLKTQGLVASTPYGIDMSAYMEMDDVIALNQEALKLMQSSGMMDGNSPSKKTIYSSLSVKVDDPAYVKEVQQAINDLDYQATGMVDVVDQMNQGTQIIQGILGGIGSISLIVAAIGITNTMVMSIYERTREIGVMKVIGASVSDIRKMFLVEASFIGLFGGILGVLFSLLFSYLLNTILGARFAYSGNPVTVSVIPLWLILGALVFSAVVGLISGYYPAKRATQLSAIDAIRTE